MQVVCEAFYEVELILVKLCGSPDRGTISMSKPPSQLQSVEQAWEISQAPPRELETDSLLLNKSAQRSQAQRSQWQPTIVVFVLSILTILSLGIVAVTLHYISDPSGALTSSTAQQMGVFPLLVRHNKSYTFKRVVSTIASSGIEKPSALCRQTTAGFFAA